MEVEKETVLDKNSDGTSTSMSRPASGRTNELIHSDVLVGDILMKDVNEILNKRRRVNAVIDLSNDQASKGEDQLTEGGKIDEVIDICDDDDDDDENCDPEEKLKRSKCLNIKCKSGEDLQLCKAMFVFHYYGMKKAKDQRVCAQCFSRAVKHQEVSFAFVSMHD